MSWVHFVGFAAPAAIALSLVAPVAAAAPASAPTAPTAAPRPTRSLARCTSIDQREKDETTLQLTVRNGCTMPIDCKVSWRLVCAPQSKKRRSVTPASTAFTLATGASEVSDLSAAACGDDSWVIRDIAWRCSASAE
jgi:hypothetical protein